MISEIDIKHYKEDNWIQPSPTGVTWAPAESDPNGKDAKEAGSKLDAGKSPLYSGLLDYFPRACLAVANVSRVGAEKYTWKGWETVPDGFKRYSDALGRHLVGESVDGMVDKATGLDHPAMAAWNAMARLELFLKDK